MFESWIFSIIEKKDKVANEIYLGSEFESSRAVDESGNIIDPFVMKFDIQKVKNLDNYKRQSQKVNVDSPRFIETMRRAMEEMFAKNGKDLLTYSEFRDSFKTFTYGLTDNDVNMLISLADEEDEKINWKKFIPLGLKTIKIFFQRKMQSVGDLKSLY
jgi:hypothetical protein